MRDASFRVGRKGSQIMLPHAAPEGSKAQPVWEVRELEKTQRGARLGFYYTKLLIQCRVPCGLSKL